MPAFAGMTGEGAAPIARFPLDDSAFLFYLSTRENRFVMPQSLPKASAFNVAQAFAEALQTA